jgi:hypothetical protein
MLLSPGTATLPDKAGAAVKVRGAGWSSIWVKSASVVVEPKKCERLLTARFAYGKARDVSRASILAPRDFCLSIEKEQAGHGEG